ncbi:hypothetical protein BBD39_11120 [Arsenophonus endosymbiont of Bemisia tabaci Asia II 3]|nr:hypothetical protein BBD39_11120 [Arsenophonus endosymbiont of Bemisia tabaci Asia II 3]
MNYLLLSQKVVRRFYIYKQNNNFQMKAFILLTFFTVPVLPAFSDEAVLNSSDSYAYDISAFFFYRRIAGGRRIQNESNSNRAVIWTTNDDWTPNEISKDLDSLGISNPENSCVNTFSTDGTIAIGTADND